MLLSSTATNTPQSSFTPAANIFDNIAYLRTLQGRREASFTLSTSDHPRSSKPRYRIPTPDRHERLRHSHCLTPTATRLLYCRGEDQAWLLHNPSKQYWFDSSPPSGVPLHLKHRTLALLFHFCTTKPTRYQLVHACQARNTSDTTAASGEGYSTRHPPRMSVITTELLIVDNDSSTSSLASF